MNSNIPPPPSKPPEFPGSGGPDDGAPGDGTPDDGAPGGGRSGGGRSGSDGPDQAGRDRTGGGTPDGPASGAAGEWPASGAAGDWPASGAAGDWPEPGAAGDYPASGAAGDWPEPHQPRRRKEFVFAEPEPLPTTARPKGPRQPNRDNRRARAGLIVAAAIVVVLLAGGAVWATNAWTGDDDETPARAAATPTPSESSTPPESPSPSKTSSPTPTDPEKIASAELTKQTKSDTATAKSGLKNKWVPQVSSKREGMKFAGITWKKQDIWDDFQSIKDEYPDALLLKSGDWKSFKFDDYWVTVINRGYDNPDEALDWCRSHGLDGDHCYAKRLSNSHGPDTSSKHQ